MLETHRTTYLVAGFVYTRRVKASLTKYLEGNLKLKVNREESDVGRPWKRKFLGYSFLSHKRAPIRLAEKTIQRFKELVREITSVLNPVLSRQMCIIF